MRDYITHSDVTVIANIAPSTSSSFGQFQCEVKQVVKSSLQVAIVPGERVTVSGVPGSDTLFLVYGKISTEGKIGWLHVLPIHDTTVDYIVRLAQHPTKRRKTLKYCVSLIGSTDSAVHSDVHEELSRASISDLFDIADAIPREKLMTLLRDADTTPNYVPLYSLMLGIVGDMESETLLEQIVFSQENDRRLRNGIGRMIVGYILLAREKGVTAVSKRWLTHADVPTDQAFIAMYAIGTVWRHSPSDRKPENLRQALYPLLSRKDLADAAVHELADMKDWTVQDRVAGMYADADTYPNPELLRREVIRYLKASVEGDLTHGRNVPRHCSEAREFLQQFGQDDLTK